MKKTSLLFIFFVAAIPFKLIAGNNDSALNKKVTQWMSNTNGLRFLENKGQMMDMQRKAVPDVLYEASGGGMSVYVTTSGLSYVFVDLKKYKKKNNSPVHFKEQNDSIIENYCRADMQLVGANIKKENIVQEDESADRSDYYYGDVCPNGILGVHSYEKLTIKNIYPGIDWILHSGKNGLKYDFIVHPGANPSLIRLKYKWADKPQLQDDGSVKISTPMGNITEGTPVSYCNGGQVHTTYTVKDSEIHFNLGTYNSTQPLIIDPLLVWGTYYGETRSYVYSMQDDGSNVWITGTTISTNFPTSNPGNGAYFQGTLKGYQNVYILQFSTAGVLKWATYYGGNGQDEGESIYSDGSNVWITGTTSSNKYFPTLNPGGGAYYQDTLAGVNVANAFILQFTTAGTRKWATYYGGNGYYNSNYMGVGGDNGNSICSDGKNVWVTGVTVSTNFPTYNPGNGTYFQGTIAGTQNLYILEFNTSGVRKWATYYGGNGGDVGNSINSDGKNVWITGHTASTNFPTLNPGGGAYFQGALGTMLNAFILQFDTSGVRKWATYYGGTGANPYPDIGISINSDGKNVWVTGYTNSTSFPLLNPGRGAYFQGHTNGEDAFILKFNTAGVCKWATCYGGSYGQESLSIRSDGVNVWVCGSSWSTDFPVYNPGCGFNQDTLGKNPTNNHSSDAFILQFDTAGIQKWGTYCGTDYETGGFYISSDRNNIFVAGDVNNPEYPMLNPGGGAYFNNTGGIETIFIGKFSITSFSLAVSPTLSICMGSADTITASGAMSYKWSPPKGLSATNIPNPVASPTITTTYTVIGIDTGSCAGTYIDSVRVIVDPFKPKNITLTKDTAICTGSSITLSASGGPSYQWNTGDTTSTISVTNLLTTSTYTVSVGDGICNTDTSVTITAIPIPNGNINGNLSICKGGHTTLAASGGTSYKWSTGDTTSAITISPSSSTHYSAVIIQNGCTDIVSELVTVAPPLSSNICCDSIITGGEKVQLISSGGHSYLWAPSTGLSCDTCPNPTAAPGQTTIYTLTYVNDSGCIAQGFVTIDVGCGTVFIPDLFSPDGAHNNILYVRGTCIASILFEVFDRWGNKIFESQNINIGWDGNHTGQPMNPGTYVWYLKATLLDGTSLEKKGNVTLVR